MICNFANGTCHGRGALGCFDILIGKSTVLITVSTVLKLKAILIMWVSLGINMFIRWVFNSCLYSIFVLMVLTCEMSDPGGQVKYSMVLHIA